MSKSPPTRRRRGPQDPATDTTQPAATTLDQAVDEWTWHGSPFCRWRHFDMNRRRREHARFKQPRPRTLPSTFGLSERELRSHANRLVLEHGWSVAEVLEVLDVEPAGMS